MVVVAGKETAASARMTRRERAEDGARSRRKRNRRRSRKLACETGGINPANLSPTQPTLFQTIAVGIRKENTTLHHTPSCQLNPCKTPSTTPLGPLPPQHQQKQKRKPSSSHPLPHPTPPPSFHESSTYQTPPSFQPNLKTLHHHPQPRRPFSRLHHQRQTTSSNLPSPSPSPPSPSSTPAIPSYPYPTP